MEIRFNKKLEEAILIVLKLIGLLIVNKLGVIIKGNREASAHLLKFLGELELEQDKEEETT